MDALAAAAAVAALLALAAPDADGDGAAAATDAAEAQRESKARSAFVLALRGDLDEAAAEAADALAASPDDALALVVLACVAIERGDLTRASARAARLEEKAAPRGPVLRRLVERRRARPSEPMHLALAEAWKAAGRPEIGSDVSLDLVDVVRLVPTIPPAAWARLSEVEQAALAGFDAREAERLRGLDDINLALEGKAPPRTAVDTTRERAVAAAAAAEQNPFWVNVLLMRSVSPQDGDTPEQRRRAADSQRRLAAALAAADPGNGYYAVIPVASARVATPASGVPVGPALGDEELAVLDAAAAEPRFEWPRRRVRAELSARLHAIDPTLGEVPAAAVSWSSSTIAPLYAVWLGVRAGAEPPPESRGGTARTLAAVGRRLGAGPLRIDRQAGISLERRAAELAGDPAKLARADAAQRAEEDRFRRETAARERLGAWPLVSAVLEDVPENDAAYVMALLE